MKNILLKSLYWLANIGICLCVVFWFSVAWSIAMFAQFLLGRPE